MKTYILSIWSLVISIAACAQNLEIPGTVTTGSTNQALQFTAPGQWQGLIRAISPVGTYSSFALYNATNLRWAIYNHHAPYPGIVNTLLIANGAGVDKIALTQDGKFGIGLTNPLTPLHISGPNTIEQWIESTTDGYASLTLKSNNKKWEWSKRPSAEGDAIWLSHNAGSGWANPAIVVRPDGKVGIGVGSYAPDAELTVKGTVHAKEVKVDLGVPGPDYVFEKDYNLQSLSDLEQYLQKHKHLPEVPSAKEMEANGINLSEMNMLLLKKIEELTLHVIELQKQNDRQDQIIRDLKNPIEMSTKN